MGQKACENGGKRLCVKREVGTCRNVSVVSGQTDRQTGRHTLPYRFTPSESGKLHHQTQIYEESCKKRRKKKKKKRKKEEEISKNRSVEGGTLTSLGRCVEVSPTGKISEEISNKIRPAIRAALNAFIFAIVFLVCY